MKRREFVTMFAGAAAAIPLATRAADAQRGARTRRVGILLGGREGDPEMLSRVRALRDGLGALGWIEGSNYEFEFRWPGQAPERIHATAAEMVRASLDVIVVGHTPSALSLRNETTSIPIIFANIADPVGSGLVASLARPGGNITGFTAFEFATAGKWLDVLKEIAPGVKRAALIFGNVGPGEKFYQALERVAQRQQWN
jgi:putative ABC transport system substrate-binding protein